MRLGNKGKKKDGAEKKKARRSGEEEEKKRGRCSGSQPRVFNIYI
jgi:hypothetical protein